MSLDHQYFLKDPGFDPCNKPNLVVIWFPSMLVLWLLFNPCAASSTSCPSPKNYETTSPKDKNNAICEPLHRKHQFVQCHSSMTLFTAFFHAVTKILGVYLQQSQMSQFSDWEECGAFLRHQNHNSSGICCVKAPSLLTQDSWSLSLSLSSTPNGVSCLWVSIRPMPGWSVPSSALQCASSQNTFWVMDPYFLSKHRPPKQTKKDYFL